MVKKMRGSRYSYNPDNMDLQTLISLDSTHLINTNFFQAPHPEFVTHVTPSRLLSQTLESSLLGYRRLYTVVVTDKTDLFG